MGVMWLLGIRTLTPEYNPESLKDAAYGKTWVNRGTDAAAYVPWCAQHGIKLSSVECGTYANAVARAHDYIDNNIPVVFTQQDDYAPLVFRDSWTHVCVFYEESQGELTCLDPYIDQPISYSDATWTQRLRSTQLWILEKLPTLEDDMPPPIDLSMPAIAGFFKQAPGNAWLCIKTGCVIGNAILTAYCSYGDNPEHGLYHLGLPYTNELNLNDATGKRIPGATYQRFELGILAYDPQHQYDKRPGPTPDVYPIKIYSGIGVDPRVAQLQSQLAALQNSSAAADSATLAQIKKLLGVS